MFQFQVVDTAVKSKSSTSLCSESSIDSSVSSADSVTQAYSVGDRIVCDGQLGTVCYVGAVAPHQGLWLGVEWDDPSRGRHDGSVNGIQYFKSSKPKAASFVRPNKVKKCKTITEAIRERYGYDPSVISNLEDIGGGLERTKLEYSQLTVIDVSSRQICDLGEPGVLAELCPKVEFLNLAENFISDWEAIGRLCLGLKHLKRLDVSENPLQPAPKTLSHVLQTVFQNLDHVILGKVKYDWDEVMTASAMWASISNLQVPYNRIGMLSPPASLQNVSSLDLGGNQISSWDDVLLLNSLPKLEYLNLFGNRISCIRITPAAEVGDSSAKTAVFPNLLRLNISENCIADWLSVSELSNLPNLKELRIDTNPFLDGETRATNRQMIIARLEKLEKLDGVDVTRQERRDAELDYVKKFAQQWSSASNKEAFLAEHPRYADLVKLYGQSEEGETNTKPRNMNTAMISLNLIPHDGSQPSVTRKLLHTMTVQKLKMLLQRIFKVPGTQIEIKVVSKQNPHISFTLDNDFHDLSQYSIEDGDTLIIKW